MLDKKLNPLVYETRRVFLYVATLCIFLLSFSCLTLLRPGTKSQIPESVFILLRSSVASVSSSELVDSSKLPHSELLTTSSIVTERNIAVRNQDIVRGNSSETSSPTEQVTSKGCALNQAAIKVYMYDLPPQFHFGLLGWKGEKNQIWPDVSAVDRIPSYPGGLNLQHSVEYWLVLDLLSSRVPGMARPCTATRVMNSSVADVFFVPFFSSLSYNRNSKTRGKGKVNRNKYLQLELVKFLESQEEWRRGGGKDHLIVAHHPNSMLQARRKLGLAIFVLADFGRYPAEVANLGKDIIAPYRHVVHSVGNISAGFRNRRILAYFQGAIYRKDGGKIRQKLYQLLKEEKDVHFAYGSVRQNGVVGHTGQGMASSKFCLNIAGDTPSSNRLFDAIVSHCVPVVISDDIELPFEDVLDYSEFCIFVRASDSVKRGFLLNLLRGIKEDEWTKMWRRLKQVAHHFEYQYPSKPGDSVQMIWDAVARKISSVQLNANRDNRFYRSQPIKAE